MKTVTLNKKDIQHFAKERNSLLASSKDDWVFFLDSDEQPDQVLQKELRNVPEKSHGINGYYIRRKNYFMNIFVGDELLVRVGRKKSGKWVKRVHEEWKIRGKIGILKGYIKHDTAVSVREMVSKINKYSGLHAMENKHRNKKSSIVKICIFPILKFVESLLQGRGLVFSILQSFHSFLGWSKQWELSKK
jgi:glycosyltransferase involved in cell wall biosynthesis